VDETLEQAREEHSDPVKRRLEQDRLDQRSSIVASQQRQLVGDQYRFADNERRQRSEHEVTEPDQILGDEEMAGHHDKVEAHEKEDCRRQYFTEFMQKPSTDPMGDPGRYPDRLRRRAFIIQDGPGPHVLSPRRRT
jgi:hypothetical protein